jgi:hypothetical protein
MPKTLIVVSTTTTCLAPRSPLRSILPVSGGQSGSCFDSCLCYASSLRGAGFAVCRIASCAPNMHRLPLAPQTCPIQCTCGCILLPAPSPVRVYSVRTGREYLVDWGMEVESCLRGSAPAVPGRGTLTSEAPLVLHGGLGLLRIMSGRDTAEYIP